MPVKEHFNFMCKLGLQVMQGIFMNQPVLSRPQIDMSIVTKGMYLENPDQSRTYMDDWKMPAGSAEYNLHAPRIKAALEKIALKVFPLAKKIRQPQDLADDESNNVNRSGTGIKRKCENFTFLL